MDQIHALSQHTPEHLDGDVGVVEDHGEGGVEGHEEGDVGDGMQMDSCHGKSYNLDLLEWKCAASHVPYVCLWFHMSGKDQSLGTPHI